MSMTFRLLESIQHFFVTAVQFNPATTEFFLQKLTLYLFALEAKNRSKPTPTHKQKSNPNRTSPQSQPDPTIPQLKRKPSTKPTNPSHINANRTENKSTSKIKNHSISLPMNFLLLKSIQCLSLAPPAG